MGNVMDEAKKILDNHFSEIYSYLTGYFLDKLECSVNEYEKWGYNFLLGVVENAYSIDDLLIDFSLCELFWMTYHLYNDDEKKTLLQACGYCKMKKYEWEKVRDLLLNVMRYSKLLYNELGMGSHKYTINKTEYILDFTEDGFSFYMNKKLLLSIDFERLDIKCKANISFIVYKLMKVYFFLTEDIYYP